MVKRHGFWIAAAIATGMWLLGVWGYQVQAAQAPSAPARVCALSAPQAQTCAQCNTQPDLQIRSIRLEPDPPGVDHSYNVHVEVYNACARANQDTWTYLYIDRAPTGDPDVQAIAPTSGLGRGESIEAHFTITQAHATAGWHTLSLRIDAQNDVPNEACGGEGNNEGATSFEIVHIYPTDTPWPTATSLAKPSIFFFTASTTTVARGDPVVLEWQVDGQAVTVTLDGELMPLAYSHTVYPDENHVYVLRAENPGGMEQKIVQIAVSEPTSTPTITPTPCQLPIIHEFGANPATVVRGERVTIYWDVDRAREVFLNGGGVEGVSQKTFRLDRTTEFVLLARNECGEISNTLTVPAHYATATPSLTPTRTLIPTRTSTPTFTPRPPTDTPTSRVLPTHTWTPGPGTATATATNSAFQSPVGTGTPTWTPVPGSTITPTVSATSAVAQSSTTPPAGTATATALPTETATLRPTFTAVPPTATWTPTFVVIAASTNTPVPGGGTMPTATALIPTVTAIAVFAGGSVRAYLCPLSVLLLFAIGVLILSIVMPRLQERRRGVEIQQHAVSAYGVVSPETQESGSGEDPDASLPPGETT